MKHVLMLTAAAAALALEPRHKGALTARRHALEVLLKASKNSNESGWLNAGLARIDAALK